MVGLQLLRLLLLPILLLRRHERAVPAVLCQYSLSVTITTGTTTRYDYYCFYYHVGAGVLCVNCQTIVEVTTSYCLQACSRFQDS